jgi:formylglycine-generating enzyme required for sulfatase activity
MMQYNSNQRFLMLIALTFFTMLSLCQHVAAQPTVKLVVDPDIRTITIGKSTQEIAIIARTDKQDVQFAWNLKGPGTLAGDNTSPGVLYIPPDTIANTTSAVITVVVTDGKGQTATGNITLILLSDQQPSPQKTPEKTPDKVKSPRVLTLQDPASNMEMAFVKAPGGSYDMGCGPWADACGNDEKLHAEKLAEFWLGQYEVTRKQWRQVNGDTANASKPDDTLPIENVSWNEVQTFLAKLSQNMPQYEFRLPTEAEWEYTCRSGGKPENYAGSNEPDSVAWYLNNSGRKLHSVGAKAPNGLGMYDLSGNVREWTQDWYAADYSHPTSGKMKIVRGGGWINAAKYVRCTNREQYLPDIPKAGLGFRVVMKKK